MNERLRRGDKYADPPRWLKLMEWIWLKQFIIAGNTVSVSISFKIEFPRSRTWRLIGTRLIMILFTG